MLLQAFRKNVISKVVSSESALIASVIDSIMISKCLGVDAMGSYGIAMPVVFIANAVAKLIADGATRQCGVSIGKGDRKQSDRIFSTSIFTSLFLAAVLMAMFLAIPELSAKLLGADGSAEVYLAGAAAYLRGYAWGIPAYVLLLVLIPFVQLEGKMVWVTVACYSMAASDVLFDILNVYVFHGGLWGMALATSLSECVGFLVLCIPFLRKDNEFHLSTADYSPRLILPLCRDGSPGFFSQFFSSVRSAVTNHAIAAFLPIGVLPLYSGISSLMNVFYPVGKGIGNTTMVLSSVFHGEEDTEGLKNTLHLSVRYSVLFHLPITLLIVVFAPLLLRLFLTVSPEEMTIAAFGVRLIAFSLIPFSIQVVYRYYLQGIGKIVQATVFLAVYECLIATASVYLLSAGFGLNGFWLSFTVREALALVVCILYILFVNRISEKKQTLSDAVLLIPDQFGIARDESLASSLYQSNDIAVFTEKARHMIQTVGCDADKLTSYVQHYSNDVFLREFPSSNTPEVRIRIYRKAGKWIVHFRDNGIKYDPTEQVVSVLPDCVVKYIRSLGHNVLIIQFPD